jgi:hypothetical protein
MRTLEQEITVRTDEEGRVVYYEVPMPKQHKKSRGKLLLAGGVLGIVGAGFVLLAPELGFASAVGGTIAALGSAGMTLLSRSNVDL